MSRADKETTRVRDSSGAHRVPRVQGPTALDATGALCWTIHFTLSQDRTRGAFLGLDHELEQYKLSTLVEAASASEIQVHRLPIVDGGVPESVPALVALVRTIVRAAEAGENVVIVCRGGLGRTGLVAASVLVALGQSPPEAIRLVRATRQGAIENRDQEGFVSEHAAALRAACTS